jgi:hypothetical protein
MKSSSAAEPPAPETDSTGLPVFRTWNRVYLLVLATFVLWVGLLMALMLVYS